MKLGCIFKLLAIVIVILGTSFYLYEKYGKDFLEESTEKAKELAIEKIEDMVNDISKREIENPLKEKLAEMKNIELSDILETVEKKKDEYSKDDFDKIVNKFKEIIKENNLNDASLEDLKKMIESKK